MTTGIGQSISTKNVSVLKHSLLGGNTGIATESTHSLQKMNRYFIKRQVSIRWQIFTQSYSGLVNGSQTRFSTNSLRLYMQGPCWHYGISVSAPPHWPLCLSLDLAQVCPPANVHVGAALQLPDTPEDLWWGNKCSSSHWCYPERWGHV